MENLRLFEDILDDVDAIGSDSTRRVIEENVDSVPFVFELPSPEEYPLCLEINIKQSKTDNELSDEHVLEIASSIALRVSQFMTGSRCVRDGCVFYLAGPADEWGHETPDGIDGVYRGGSYVAASVGICFRPQNCGFSSVGKFLLNCAAIEEWIEKWIWRYGNFAPESFIMYFPDREMFGVSTSSLKWLKNCVKDKKTHPYKYMALVEKYMKLYGTFRPEFEPEDEEKFIDSVLKWKF